MGLYVLLLAAAAGTLFVKVVRELAKSRQRPRVLIAEAREGMVRIVGRTRMTAGKLKAPLTGRECLVFTLTVVDHSRDSGGTVLREAQSVPFVVADDSGEAWVDPTGSLHIALTADRKGSVGGFFDRELWPDERQRLLALLEAKGIETATVFGGARKFSFDERILDVDSPVAVTAVALWEAATDGEPPTPRAPGERLTLRNTEDQPLLLSTAPSSVTAF